ncbi:MAG: hypothetical protein GC164_12575 [Phycisphaera sp.]|nr:hypothetical protein [Phycisphaera sp.]
MLGLLQRFGVEFLVVGGYAVGVHDRPRATGDLDIWVRPTPDNANRLWQALVEFGAPLTGVRENDFARMGLVYQMGCEPQRIDVLTSLAAVGFDEAWPQRVEVEIDGVKVYVLGRDHLVRNKQSVARDQDLLDAKNIIKRNAPPTGKP